MRRRDQRLIVIGAAGALLALAATLTFIGLRDQVDLFVAPSDLAAIAEPGQRLRLGGLVAAGSVRRDADGALRFTVTDGAASVEVRFAGIAPDLFREGQGVVAEGVLNPDRSFEAARVLAKHDETYMPREVAEALKQRGVWKGAAPP